MSQNKSSEGGNLHLIVGLGNPGARYASTRHNVGFMVVDELARRHGLRFSAKQADAEVARGQIGGVPVILAKPLTFMNNSGTAVSRLVRFYKIPVERLLVVYDDYALPLGLIRVRARGSSGGHNGMESVIRLLGTQNFPRLRVGVDRPDDPRHSTVDWVLSRFTPQERKVLSRTIPHAVDAIETFLREGVDRAMNLYNTRDAGQQVEPGEHEHSALRAATQGVGVDEGLADSQGEGWAERVRRIIRKGVNGR
jgi:PTH1 family peptidyl-tRNA hydrolase